MTEQLQKNLTIDLIPLKPVVPKLDLVLIPSGSFLMGSDDGCSDERPVHKVKIIKPFYMGKYPVTQGQWQAVMGSHPSHFDGSNLPVEQVSWDDAQKFCKNLSSKTGKAVRLPTEAEWEYACRAGTKTRYCSGDSEDDLKRVAWYSCNSRGATHHVGQKEPNEFGLYDMHGNVWEWCQDCYGAYEAKSTTDPKGPASGSRHVLRGGSWDSIPANCRPDIRMWSNQGSRNFVTGFRVVVAPTYRTL